MSREAFRLFMVIVIMALIVGGSYLGWHFTHQHQECTSYYGQAPTCKTVYGS